MGHHDKPWSLEFEPVYDSYEPYFDGYMHHYYMDTIRYVRFAIKSGDKEVFVLHCTRPQDVIDPDEGYIYSYRIMDDDSLSLNPFEQLLADAELGRRARKAGLRID